MDSTLDIWNSALGHLGSDFEIQTINEQTKEARVMRRHYWGLLKSIQGSYAWWAFTVFQQLSLQSIYKTPEWPFVYQYPANCLKLVRFWNQGHTDTLEDSVKYVKSNIGTQTVIMSEYGPTSVLLGTPYAPIQPTLPVTVDVTTIPVAQFIQYTENVSLFPEMFKQCLAFILAAYAAPSIPGIGQTDLREKNLQLGNAALAQAVAQDANESRPPVDLRSIIQKAGQGSGRWTVGVGYQAYNADTWPGGV